MKPQTKNDEFDSVQFKLDLARAFLENGQEKLARGIITKLINDRIEEK
jgi:Tfp pilus assembly protein FimV